MKSNGSATSGNRIRAKVLLQVGAVALLVAMAAFLIPLRSKPPAKASVGEQAAVPETSAVPSRPALELPPLHPSLQSQKPESESDAARMISLMLDKSMAIQVRRQAARTLGKIGTPEAMAALKSALTNDTPPYVKAAIAEGLGDNSTIEARDLLHQLVTGKDETTARGAARGLATRGDAGAVDTLGNLLFNDQTPMSVRTEAALALGDVSLPAAQDLLTRAITQIHNEDVVESVIDGLGRRPFAETEEFFRNYLNSRDVPTESKVLAIQAVRDAEGDNVTSFLSNYLNDANPDVRAAAKQALSFLNPPTPLK